MSSRGAHGVCAAYRKITTYWVEEGGGSDVNTNQVEILIVDDLPDNLDLLRRVLETADFSVRLATSGQAALQTEQAQPPELILLDIAMPIMDGFETCRRLKADPATQDIPVIFLTGQGETEKVI